MKRRTRYGSTGKQDRLEMRHRRQCPGPADLNTHIQEPRRSLTGGILVCDRPTRGFCRGPKFVLQRRRIYLNDHAVYLIIERVALCFHLVYELDELVEITT